MKKIHVEFGERSYDIHVERGSLSRVAKIFSISHKFAFIITDSGVPSEYAKAVADGFEGSYIHTVPMGEGAKSIEIFGAALEKMVSLGMTRSDVVISVGGGVVGDLSGFVASAYMRGIDFYNVPTTLLSMVDSSIGGKTAINLSGVKNVVGAIYQPRGVLIDIDTLATLPRRQIANGLAESIKMAATSDSELFEFFESCDDPYENIEDVILRSVDIKRCVVEADEREGGIRKILNFGHTFGHAVEAATDMEEFYHGECVAIGMAYVTTGEVHKRIVEVLDKVGLPTRYEGDLSDAFRYIQNDKKRHGSRIDAIILPKIGKVEICPMSVDDFIGLVNKNTGGEK